MSSVSIRGAGSARPGPGQSPNPSTTFPISLEIDQNDDGSVHFMLQWSGKQYILAGPVGVMAPAFGLLLSDLLGGRR